MATKQVMNFIKGSDGKQSYTYIHAVVLFAIAYTLFQLPQIVKNYKKVPQTVKVMYWATLIVFAVQFAIILYLLPKITECSISGKCQKIGWFLFAIGLIMAVEKLFIYVYTLKVLQDF